MAQANIDHKINPRFVPGDIPLWLGNAKDSAIIYDATADDLTLQTQNASAVLIDRIRVESGTDTPFVEFVAGRLRLLDAAADPGAAGEISRNGADLKVYSGGAVRNLTNVGSGLSNIVEDTTPQLGGDLDCQNNALNNIGGVGQNLSGQSTQAALEAETDEDTYVPPDLIKHSPGVAKAWADVSVSAGTPAVDASYNMTGIGDQGVGDYRMTIATDFSSADFVSVASGHDADGTDCVVVINQKSAGITDLELFDLANPQAAVDGYCSVVYFGVQ